MVSAISGGMSALSSMFSMQTSSTSTITNTSNSNFDAILGSSQSQSSSESSSSSSEMDLNGDGQVTIDEIMKYLEMQMQEQMLSNAEAYMDAAGENSQSENLLGGEQFDNSQFKAKQAISAYLKGL